ncbi:MAG: hypothetical protein AB4426_06890 [Xenococcaceae cyanobacterium]
MSDLIYPNLFLFLYDLREGLEEEKEELTNYQRNFAAKFPEDLGKYLFDRDIAFESEYLELLTNQIEKFTESDKPFEGYYYPVRLNDIYGLLLACSFPNNTTRHPADCVAKLKNKIEQKLDGQGATLGQTWLILAHLDAPNRNPEEIAQNCCQALNLGLNWERDLQSQGHLLGGTLFELSRYQLLMQRQRHRNLPAPTLEQIQQSHHLIIALYPDAATAKQAAAFNFDWLRLFCYRHKILWAYTQSRYLKQLLKQDFIEIKTYTKDIKSKNLKQLRQTVIDAQNTLSRYTIDLNYLGYQIRTIEVNLMNYNRRLRTIQESLSQIQVKAGEESIKRLLPDRVFSWFQASAANSTIASANQSSLLTQLGGWQHPCDLKFLEKFSDDVTNKYLLQLQKDYENLSPGLRLLEDLINSIRGIAEIGQAQRDRTFQNTVAIVGVGLAAGSTVVSIADQFPVPSKYPIGSTLSGLGVPDPWLIPTTSVVISLGAAIAAGGLTALVIQLISLVRRIVN